MKPIRTVLTVLLPTFFFCMAAFGAIPGNVTAVNEPACTARAVFALFWVLILAAVFAKVEIQIEGADGWAGKLPTWRIENHWLLNIFWGGRPMTGYHMWMFMFVALVFHWPLFATARFTWRLEALIIGSILVFWIVEDFLWFVMNPAFGIRRFKSHHIPWHLKWTGPVPTDYVVFMLLAAILFWFSCSGGN